MIVELIWSAYRVSRVVSLLLATGVIVAAIRWLATGAAWSHVAAIPGMWIATLWLVTLLPYICLAVVMFSLNGLWLTSGATIPKATHWLNLAIALGPLLVTVAVTAAWFMSRHQPH